MSRKNPDITICLRKEFKYSDDRSKSRYLLEIYESGKRVELGDMNNAWFGESVFYDKGYRTIDKYLNSSTIPEKGISMKFKLQGKFGGCEIRYIVSHIKDLQNEHNPNGELYLEGAMQEYWQDVKSSKTLGNTVICPYSPDYDSDNKRRMNIITIPKKVRQQRLFRVLQQASNWGTA